MPNSLKITLRPSNGLDDFFLLKESCNDGYFRCSRSAVREAIKHAASDLTITHMRMTYSDSGRHLQAMVYIIVTKSGCLSLGCHSFGLTNSKKIIKWANARRKVRRG